MGSVTLPTSTKNMSKITAAFILLHFNFQPSYGFLASLSTSPHRHHCCNYNEQQIHEQLHPITTSTTIINTAAEIASTSTSTSTSLNVKSKLTHAIESIHPNQPPRPKRVPFLPSTNNPYIIFKLDQNASKEEIKKAYNKNWEKNGRLAKDNHSEEFKYQHFLPSPFWSPLCLFLRKRKNHQFQEVQMIYQPVHHFRKTNPFCLVAFLKKWQKLQPTVLFVIFVKLQCTFWPCFLFSSGI